MGAQNLHKSRSHLKIRGSKKVTWSVFYSKDLQMLGATVKKFRRPGVPAPAISAPLF